MKSELCIAQIKDAFVGRSVELGIDPILDTHELSTIAYFSKCNKNLFLIQYTNVLCVWEWVWLCDIY